MRSMQWQLGILGTISAFAYRHKETKKNLCRGGRSQVLEPITFVLAYSIVIHSKIYIPLLIYSSSHLSPRTSPTSTFTFLIPFLPFSTKVNSITIRIQNPSIQIRCMTFCKCWLLQGNKLLGPPSTQTTSTAPCQPSSSAYSTHTEPPSASKDRLLHPQSEGGARLRRGTRCVILHKNNKPCGWRQTSNYAFVHIKKCQPPACS